MKILDWNQYKAKAIEVVEEGCVLIKNDNNVLPIDKNSQVSVFGRIQTHYYKSGTGSGGMVNVSRVYGIIEGLESEGVEINRELLSVYTEWEKEHPFDEGCGWGTEPWSQEEMPLDDAVVRSAAGKSDSAIVIIGRSAGEDKDAKDAPGSYRLTDIEEDMLAKVRKYFDRVIVLLNVGAIMDMSWIDVYSPDAVMYVWQGGMFGGFGVASLLTGKAVPSGKLTDTIAFNIEDYPSDANFGNELRDFYCEDIYVGYRYFETFAKDKVRYPFGYGLSYTEFDIETTYTKCDGDFIELGIKVTNTGKYAGKEVVQVYVSAPQGKLGNPARKLVAFAKTELLESGASGELAIKVSCNSLTSYDDSGVTGHKSAWVLEAGEYGIYVGNSVRSAIKVCSYATEERVIKQYEEALAPVMPYNRMKAELVDGVYKTVEEPVPLCTKDMDLKRLERLPEEISVTGDKGYRLSDVLYNKTSMERFIAQMTDDDLACIVRGEGMGSTRVTPGTAAAFGGVSDRLVGMGIPAVCCDDGPSGMRLDCGMKAFSIPNGTLLSSTYNTEIISELYAFLGLEMIANKVDNLLGPGMNIHRHPLNGRNFEYFSEDPYVTGVIASAELKGLQSSGVTGTIKHFAGNNQEFRRRFIDSVISERALREIYLKGFEIAVKEGNANSIMTTYGSLNGLWTAGSYDLNTTILRKEWGYTGIVMTDWWAEINNRGCASDQNNFAAMVRAQNDLYMVCPDGSKNTHGDNTLKELEEGKLTRAELQRCAMNICNHVMYTEAMRRLLGKGTEVEIINRPLEDNDIGLDDVEVMKLVDGFEYDLSYKDSKKGENYIISLDIERLGIYKLTVSGQSKLSELAQIPCTLFYTGIPCMTFTFNGSGGKTVEITKDFMGHNRFALLRLHVGANGVKLDKMRFDFVRDLRPEDRP